MRRTAGDALPGLLLLALVLATFLFLVHPQVLKGELIDPDSYMHVVRLETVIETGGWEGGFIARDNAPYGTALHWSKAYDLLYLALAAPLAAALGWREALERLAPAIGPLSLIALLFAALWAVRPVTEAAERRFLGMLIATTPILVNYGMVGSATYHVGIVAAWVVFMGFALRLITPPYRARDGFAAGIAAAFALWLTVECIFALALALALVGAAAVREGRALRAGHLALALALALAVPLLVACDPPFDGWLYPELERLSIVYAAFAILHGFVAALIATAPQARDAWRVRLLVALAASLAAALALALLFPSLVTPERAVFGADLQAQFWGKIEEMKPAFSTTARGMLFMTGPALGFAAALLFAWKAASIEDRAGWGWCALMILLLSVPALLHVRFAGYPEIVAALPLARLLVWLHGRFAATPHLALRLLGGTVALTAVLLGPVLAAGAVVAIKGVEAPGEAPDCAVHHVAAFLDDAAFMGGRDLILMTEPDQAPETLYWTPHRVVAGPYHRNVAGLRDVIAVMTGTDQAEARAILARRGVAYVLICARMAEAERDAKAGKHGLWERLVRGEAPAWLAAKPWPGGGKSDLRLFRFVPGAANG